jgi:Spx/MgsR family transcriptional regulator
MAWPGLPGTLVNASNACLCATCLQVQLNHGVIVYGIANCDTVKKAKAWLTEHGVEYALWDYKKHGVPHAQLKQWLQELGWQTVLNTRGTTWRSLPDAAKAAVQNESSAFDCLSTHASAIKRPIITWGNTYQQALTAGFDAVQWYTLIKI